MKTYARIDGGKVAELLETTGDIKKMFHPSLVWVDGTGAKVGDSYQDGVFTSPTPDQPTTLDKIQAAESAVEAMLNAGANKRGYDNIINAALRAGYAGPFHDEGVAYATWMDECWAKCYAVMADVKAMKRAEPTPAELVAEMPALLLP